MSYRTAKTKTVTALVAVLVSFALLDGRALADNPPSSQADSYTDTYYKNAQGSDSSLQTSSIYAMQALMDLAGGKLTGAVKNGYNAYGKYRNSENLDRLKDQNAQLANAMASVDAGPTLPTERTNTTFRRLDTSFLHQGDAGKVADEFEKQTGMKRETFLTQMADVSEQKIKRSDPMMIDKAFSRFEGFLQKIPNQDFRKNAEKSIAMVPDTMRRGMVAQAVQKLAGMFADGGASAPSALDSTISELAKNKLPDASATAKAAGSSATTGAADLAKGGKDAKKDGKDSDATRTPASNGDGSLTATLTDADKGGINGGSGKNGAEGAVAAALAAQGGQDGQSSDGSADGVTIFQQVTKRYRILTPILTKTP